MHDRMNYKLWIDQKVYAVDLLACFGMVGCKPLSMPMDPNIKLTKEMGAFTDVEKEAMAAFPYIQATGALLYLALCTCPDIAYVVGVLCRFNSNPGPKHWKALKRLLQFVAGTLDYRIEYSAEAALLGPELFKTYSDADHGPDNGKSTTRSVIILASSAVDWTSKLQSIIAMSTTEAEFIVASITG